MNQGLHNSEFFITKNFKIGKIKINKIKFVIKNLFFNY
jgi:hypothetical protein